MRIKGTFDPQNIMNPGKEVMTMQAEWRKAIQRFILNNLGQMDQEDVEVWLDDELDLAPLLEAPMKAQAQHRDQILRELH